MVPDETPPLWHVHLRDGTPVRLRPVGPGDRDALQQGVERLLSSESRRRRFLTPLESLTEEQLDHLTTPDGVDHIAIGAFGGIPPSPAGVGCCIRRPGTNEAELALTVADAWQGRGLGTVLLAAVAVRAMAAGIGSFHADLLADNGPVLAILRRCGAAATMHSLEGVTEARIDLVALTPLFERFLDHGGLAA